jgi:hypothetical protein
MIEALRKVIKRMHYPLEVMLTCVRWYVAYPLSLRHIEEMMAERGVSVDHATIHRWALKIVPALVKVFRGRKADHKADIEMRQCKYLISLSRTIAPSSASLDRCWASNRCASPGSFWRVSRRCT